MKDINKLIDEVQTSLAQPALDEIVGLIQSGKKEQALKLLLEEEGHWLKPDDGKRYIDWLALNAPLIYEYKLNPLNRQTGVPAFKQEDVRPQFAVDLNELFRVMNSVHKREGMVAMVLTDEMDRDSIIDVVAKAFSEMWGADIYYRRKGETQWEFQRSVWRPKK